MSVLADFAERRRITFPLLSDVGSATIKAYGLLNTTVPASNRQQYGIPFPGTLIVNRQSVVTSRTFESEYQERDTISSVMLKLGTRVDIPAMSVAAPHLRILTFTTDHVVAPGTHSSIVVDASRGAETALADKRELVINATLDYQACDDKVCFNPQSVPLSWTVQVKALDRERVKR